MASTSKLDQSEEDGEEAEEEEVNGHLLSRHHSHFLSRSRFHLLG